jgi:hypothetical protein
VTGAPGAVVVRVVLSVEVEMGVRQDISSSVSPGRSGLILDVGDCGIVHGVAKAVVEGFGEV